MSETPEKTTHRDVTDQHRAVAQLALREFWLMHVFRVAERAWRHSESVQLYPPNANEIEAVAQVIADHETVTTLELAI
jgi:hypothetical protein